jgi:hypothetical protein
MVVVVSVTVSMGGFPVPITITLNVAFEGVNNSPLTGIPQIQGGAALGVYPNPTTGKVYLQTAGSIKVYSLQGALLHETSGTETDLSAYPQGVYILQAGSQTVKVVKE